MTRLVSAVPLQRFGRQMLHKIVIRSANCSRSFPGNLLIVTA